MVCAKSGAHQSSPFGPDSNRLVLGLHLAEVILQQRRQDIINGWLYTFLSEFDVGSTVMSDCPVRDVTSIYLKFGNIHWVVESRCD